MNSKSNKWVRFTMTFCSVMPTPILIGTLIVNLTLSNYIRFLDLNVYIVFTQGVRIATVVAIFTMMFVYLAHLLKTRNERSLGKTMLWTVSLLIMPYFMVPVFWYFFVRPRPKVENMGTLIKIWGH